jgi:cytoskeletal protein RodZ
METQEIGRRLREARERLGIALDEAERSTRIRAERLHALEQGDFDSLPSRAQARGFLKNYSEYLGLPNEELLDEFDHWKSGRRSYSTQPRPTTPTFQASGFKVWRRRLLSSDVLVTGLVALMVVSMLVWGGSRLFARIGQSVEVTEVPELALESTIVPTSTPLELSPANEQAVSVTLQIPSGPTETPPLQLGPQEEVRIELIGEQQSWVQVSVDGELAFQGRMEKGDSQLFVGTESVALTTGNAGGVRVIYNNQDQGMLGEVSSVVTRVWTKEGIQTPTPTATLTPTITPTPSRTPLQSPTSSAPTGG